jgi:hypothetical protein
MNLLTLLAEGKMDKAKGIFEDISQSEVHPRRAAAKKAAVGIDLWQSAYECLFRVKTIAKAW